MAKQDMALPTDRAADPSGSNPQAVSSIASIPSAVVREFPGGHVTLFTVRSGWEWGNIYVRPLREGAEVVAHSSFGTYGYTWAAMGGNWREFLSSCSREYAMRKMAGHSYDTPLGRDEFIAAMKAEIDDYEKSVLDAWGILDDDQRRRVGTCREVLEDEWIWDDVPQQALFWYFNDQANGAPYAMELYEARLTKINPQVIGFWDEIWTPFAQAIEAGTAMTEGHGTKDESAVATPCAQSPSEDTE